MRGCAVKKKEGLLMKRAWMSAFSLLAVAAAAAAGMAGFPWPR